MIEQKPDNRRTLRRPMRKLYMTRLVLRCAVLLSCIAFYFYTPGQLKVVQKGQFFQSFSVLHLLWLAWMGDMLLQLIPARRYVALGSQKIFGRFFSAAGREMLPAQIKRYLRTLHIGALRVLVVWVLMIAAIGGLYISGVLGPSHLFLISVGFYVCDLICVLFWCPFQRFLMKNRCCTTCRIFNWDHMMMFTPMIYLRSFFAGSLLAMSLIVMAVWELSVLLHPERFCEQTNAALCCSACTDRLCAGCLQGNP